MKRVIILSLIVMACLNTAHAEDDFGFGKKTVKASSHYVSKKMKVSTFNRLVVTGPAEVTYTLTEGDSQVEIYTADNVMEHVVATVSDGKLSIQLSNKVNVKNLKKLEVKVSSPQLKSVKVTGSGTVDIASEVTIKQMNMAVTGSGSISANQLTCEDYEASVTGSGDIDVKALRCNNATAKVTGSGDIDLKGTTLAATYKVTGSGDVDAKDLVADTVDASVTGSGDITCQAVKRLDTHIIGSGGIGYKGKPGVLIQKPKGVHHID